MLYFLSAPSRRLAVGLLLAASCLYLSAGNAAAGCASPTVGTPQGGHYKANAPLRTTLADKGITGTKLVLTGRILDHNCRSVLGALIDFWHADDLGRYDNADFKLRGRQNTDTQGRYRLETIVPGAEVGKARALYVKLAAPGGRIVTTRLYFPDDAQNATDPLFRPELLLALEHAPEGVVARFDFVLPP